MPSKKTPSNPDKLRQLVQDERRRQAEREGGYRARALELFDPVCGHCGREFEGKKLRELTVHHKDHNHDNNPPDGSNWELLCIYCHDNEHQRDMVAEVSGPLSPRERDEGEATHQPFANLAKLLKKK